MYMLQDFTSGPLFRPGNTTASDFFLVPTSSSSTFIKPNLLSRGSRHAAGHDQHAAVGAVLERVLVGRIGPALLVP
ncbi:hypothetical protein INR49_029501 [Caranx melampygus]|nr:hypothetical protein INR49_029501 [Caranx melampygus]